MESLESNNARARLASSQTGGEVTGKRKKLVDDWEIHMITGGPDLSGPSDLSGALSRNSEFRTKIERVLGQFGNGQWERLLRVLTLAVNLCKKGTVLLAELVTNEQFLGKIAGAIDDPTICHSQVSNVAKTLATFVEECVRSNCTVDQLGQRRDLRKETEVAFGKIDDDRLKITVELLAIGASYCNMANITVEELGAEVAQIKKEHNERVSEKKKARQVEVEKKKTEANEKYEAWFTDNLPEQVWKEAMRQTEDRELDLSKLEQIKQKAERVAQRKHDPSLKKTLQEHYGCQLTDLQVAIIVSLSGKPAQQLLNEMRPVNKGQVKKQDPGGGKPYYVETHNDKSRKGGDDEKWRRK